MFIMSYSIVSTGEIDTKLFDAKYTNAMTGVAMTILLKEIGSALGFAAEIILGVVWKDQSPTGTGYFRHNQSKCVDLIAKLKGHRDLEVKCIGASGTVDLRPSVGKGAGRLPQDMRFYATAKTTDYVVVDSAHLKKTGSLRYAILSGQSLIANNTCRLTKRDTDALIKQMAPTA